MLIVRKSENVRDIVMWRQQQHDNRCHQLQVTPTMA
jgi:hypothetical protein